METLIPSPKFTLIISFQNRTSMVRTNLVTGAFSYTNRYVAQKLIAANEKVRTMTNHSDPTQPHYNQIEIKPYEFENLTALRENFRGINTFVNSFWVRYDHETWSFDRAVEFTKIMLELCVEEDVEKIIHYSVTNPSLDSPYPYFRGKAALENAIKKSGLVYTILRPAFIYERGDILLANIAWTLRKFPLFGIPGNGNYRIQPISSHDMADVVFNCRLPEDHRDETIDVIGPEDYTFLEIVRMIKETIGVKCWIIRFQGPFSGIPYYLSKVINLIKKDRVITKDELNSLRDNLLYTSSPPTGNSSFSEWLRDQEHLGKRYESEYERHF